jgi:hypothetical protein
VVIKVPTDSSGITENKKASGINPDAFCMVKVKDELASFTIKK